jgi:hypothetical protein
MSGLILNYPPKGDFHFMGNLLLFFVLFVVQLRFLG